MLLGECGPDLVALGPPVHPPGQRAGSEPADTAGLEVRERLYTTAVALLAERGFTETTMDDIAERADVARASTRLTRA